MSNEYGSKGSEALDLPGLSDYFQLEQLEVFKWVSESTRAATASPGEEALRLAGELVTEGSGGRTGLSYPGMMLVLMSEHLHIALTMRPILARACSIWLKQRMSS